jgi:WD40 repeat protein
MEKEQKGIISSGGQNGISPSENLAHRGLSIFDDLQDPRSLNSESHPTVTSLCRADGYTPYSFDISSDQTRAVAGCDDGTFIHWDLRTGKELFRAKAHRAKARTVAISADGEYAVSAGDDSQMFLWNLQNGERLLKFPGTDGNCQKVLMPSQRYVITASLWGAIQIWDIGNSGSEFMRLGFPTYPEEKCAVTSLALTNNSRALVSAGDFFGFGLWELATGKLVGTPNETHDSLVWDIAFSPDQQFMVTASRDHTIGIWDMSSGRLDTKLEGHTADVFSVSFLSDRILASAGADKSVRIWNIATGQQLKSFNGFDQPVGKVVPSQDGNSLLACVLEEGIYRWNFQQEENGRKRDARRYISLSPDLASAGKIRVDQGHSAKVEDVWISPDEARIFTADHTLKIIERSLSTGNIIHTTQVPMRSGITQPSFSRNLKYAISSDPWDASLLYVYDLQTASQIGTFSSHKDTVMATAISPDGKIAFSADLLDVGYLWDLPARKVKSEVEDITGPYNDVRFSEDGQRIIAGGLGPVQVWDASSGNILASFSKGIRNVRYVQLSPDNQYASAAGDAGIYFWDLKSKELCSIYEPAEKVTAISFLHHHPMAALGTASGKWLLIDWMKNQVLREFFGHQDAVTAIGISLEDRFLITGSSDHTTIVWGLGEE